MRMRLYVDVRAGEANPLLYLLLIASRSKLAHVCSRANHGTCRLARAYTGLRLRTGHVGGGRHR